MSFPSDSELTYNTGDRVIYSGSFTPWFQGLEGTVGYSEWQEDEEEEDAYIEIVYVKFEKREGLDGVMAENISFLPPLVPTWEV